MQEESAIQTFGFFGYVCLVRQIPARERYAVSRSTNFLASHHVASNQKDVVQIFAQQFEAPSPKHVQINHNERLVLRYANKSIAS